MRYAFYRITAPILDRIPDISHQPKSRQMSIGLAASLLFHLLLLVAALVVSLVIPRHSLLEFAKSKPKLQEIEVTLIPEVSTEVPELVTPEKLEEMKQMLDSTGLKESAAAPEKPVFESDVNMKAASRKAGTGDVPLPSLDGRTDRPMPQFTNQNSTNGPPEPAPPPAPTVTPQAPAPPPEPAPAAAAEPKPMTAEASPPQPLKEVDAPSPDEIALARKEAAPPTPPAPKLQMRTTMPLAMLTTPPPARSTYQPFQEKTQIDGNISNRGENAVDAEGTPMGRYHKGIRIALGSRWNHYVTGGGSAVMFPPGSVRVSFKVDRRGKISDIQTQQNTSTTGYAIACEKAVRDTKLPPPPKGLFDPLPNGKLDITFTFTIYSPF